MPKRCAHTHTHTHTHTVSHNLILACADRRRHRRHLQVGSGGFQVGFRWVSGGFQVGFASRPTPGNAIAKGKPCQCNNGIVFSSSSNFVCQRVTQRARPVILLLKTILSTLSGASFSQMYVGGAAGLPTHVTEHKGQLLLLLKTIPLLR